MSSDELSLQDPAITPIHIGKRLAESDSFRELFSEGMALVEETASYLDGPGRQDSADLDRTGSLTYATESMRLTTRLMQIASWLLLQKAVNEGEITKEQAGQEKDKVRLETLSTARQGEGWDALPDAMKDLIMRSLRLQSRVGHFERLLSDDIEPDEHVASPVADQLGLLSVALGARVE